MIYKGILAFYLFIGMYMDVFAQSDGDYYRRYMLYQAYTDSAEMYQKDGQYYEGAKQIMKAEKVCPYFHPEINEYNMACFFSRANMIDSAVFHLKKCSDLEDVTDGLKNDSGFKNLRNDTSIFTELYTYFLEQEQKSEPNINKPLKMQLMKMFCTDQSVRQSIKGFTSCADVANAKSTDSISNIQNIDNSNYLALKRIVAVYGWPTFALVGREASNDAWLVLQHCGDSFQKACLPLLEKAVANNQASEQNLAYLKDRISCNNSQKQFYGTQIKPDNLGNMSLCPVWGEEGLDFRRELIGLEPIGVYVKQWNIFYMYKN